MSKVKYSTSGHLKKELGVSNYSPTRATTLKNILKYCMCILPCWSVCPVSDGLTAAGTDPDV